LFARASRTACDATVTLSSGDPGSSAVAAPGARVSLAASAKQKVLCVHAPSFAKDSDDWDVFPVNYPLFDSKLENGINFASDKLLERRVVNVINWRMPPISARYGGRSLKAIRI